MAMTSFKRPENSSNRSRSSSCSSPIRNRFVYREIFSVGASTLVRSYSCDQVFNKDSNGRTFQTTQIQFSSFITPEKKVGGKSLKYEPQKPRRLALEYPTMKTKVSRFSTKPIKLNIFMSILKQTFIFILLTASSACIYYYYITYKECGYVWRLDKTEEELKENVFGQDEAVVKVNSVLRFCNSSVDLHVMVFTGGVGVGKTYTSSIIRRNFPWVSNKLVMHSKFFVADVEKLLNQKLSICGVNLVTVDDLSANSLGDAINIIALLNGIREKNVNLLIILIFRAPTEKEKNEIMNEFKNNFLNIHHIHFKPLSLEVVKKCFLVEVQRQGVDISKEELSKLVEDKLKPVEVVKGPPGCKGVSEEVASFIKT